MVQRMGHDAAMSVPLEQQAVSVQAAHAGSAPGRDDRHLFALSEVSTPRLLGFLRGAREYLGVCDDPSLDTGELSGRAVSLVFLEESTRTRMSFTLAALRLGASVVDLAAGASSVKKGESVFDTAATLDAMGVSLMVVRASEAGSCRIAAEACRCPVVNAGEGSWEHPTQGLIDVVTLAEAKGRLSDFDLSGIRVVIAGDVLHSRVARSASAGMRRLGAHVTFAGPPAFAPECMGSQCDLVTSDFEGAIREADAVMMLRVQFERHAGADTSPEARAKWHHEFRASCGLTRERFATMKPTAHVMHPGPMNRGLEVESEVADDPRSLIRRQVRAGVAVRMAVMRGLCAAGGTPC